MPDTPKTYQLTVTLDDLEIMRVMCKSAHRDKQIVFGARCQRVEDLINMKIRNIEK